MKKINGKSTIKLDRNHASPYKCIFFFIIIGNLINFHSFLNSTSGSNNKILSTLRFPQKSPTQVYNPNNNEFFNANKQFETAEWSKEGFVALAMEVKFMYDIFYVFRRAPNG